MIGSSLRRRLPQGWRFLLFLIVGGINTLINYLVFLALVFAGTREGMAVAAAWIIGITFNFFSTGKVVFQSSDARRLPRFVAVYLVQLVANLGLLHLATHVGIDARIAQAAILGMLAIISFIAMRYFVFAEKHP